MQTSASKGKKGKGNLFYVKNTGSGCPGLPSRGLMIEVFDIHVKRKKKKKKDCKHTFFLTFIGRLTRHAYVPCARIGKSLRGNVTVAFMFPLQSYAL